MKHCGFYDKIDGSPTYPSALASKGFSLMYEGISYGFLNEFEVTRTTGNSVTVDTGGMVNKGRWYVEDETIILSVDPASSGYLRKDWVMVEFNIDTKEPILKIYKGIEVTSNPVAQDLATGEDIWHVPLALLNIEGSIIKLEGGVEDKRVIGNRRTTPNFEEPISAPKVSSDMMMVKTGGKTCFASEDTYIQHDGNNLNFKENGCEVVQMALVICGTEDPPATGVYPEKTIYIKYID